ncbi:hypothetical protein [Candidatus Methanomethylophilus sp. 1R26]|uniref:hypothetical protein n=1 Tax=Candidatus Methanomethylophilus sp. 1R26 TaxID=1769296 RepID=UPI0012FEAD47|nr:hypothetical protein [Candidatus Methanomethylophilus sp. 1R26]
MKHKYLVAGTMGLAIGLFVSWMHGVLEDLCGVHETQIIYAIAAVALSILFVIIVYKERIEGKQLN